MKLLRHLLFLELVFIFFACSIEKRHYQPGYHIDWVNSKKHANRQNKQQQVYKAPTLAAGIQVETSKADQQLKYNFPKSQKSKSQKITAQAEPKVEVNNSRRETNPKQSDLTSSKNKTSKNKSGDGMFIMMSGILGTLTLGLFRWRINRIKKVSYWAKNNKRKSRIALTGLKFFLAGLGIYTGKVLFENHLLISETITNALLLSSLFAAFFYPDKKAGEKGNSYYFRQKTHDFVLSMSGFLAMASVSNHALADENYFPFANSVMKTMDQVYQLPDNTLNQSNPTEYTDQPFQIINFLKMILKKKKITQANP